MLSISFQSRLFQDAVQRTRGKVIGRMSSYGDSSGFARMLILTMTSFHGYQNPAIRFDHLDDFTDFQDSSP